MKQENDGRRPEADAAADLQSTFTLILNPSLSAGKISHRRRLESYLHTIGSFAFRLAGRSEADQLAGLSIFSREAARYARELVAPWMGLAV